MKMKKKDQVPQRRVLREWGTRSPDQNARRRATRGRGIGLPVLLGARTGPWTVDKTTHATVGERVLR